MKRDQESVPDDARFAHGIELFNAGKFFDAHEVLEDVWRPATGTERVFLQGVIQFAVALHHFSRGNTVGARSLLTRAAIRFDQLPADCHGPSVRALQVAARQWLEHLASPDSPQPPFPRL